MDTSGSGPDADVTALAEGLRQAVGGFVRAIRDGSASPRTAQSEALALLDREGEMTVSAMARRRRVRHQTMRLVVQHLEQAGQIERRADPGDGRSQLCALTQAGRDELGRGRGSRATRIEALIRTRLSPAEREVLRTAVALLTRMSAGLDGPAEVSPP